MPLRRTRLLLLCLASMGACPLFPVPGAAQVAAPYVPRTLTADDYARAEKFMPYNTTPLVLRAVTHPTWGSNDRLWYRATIAQGSEFVLVDPAKRTRGPAFDQARLAAALSAASGVSYDAFHLPFTEFDFLAGGESIAFNVKNRRWTCDLRAYRCIPQSNPPQSQQPARGEEAGPPGRNQVISPDGKLAAFVRDYNLWVRDLAAGKETQLTADGVKDDGYATDNAGWSRSDRPILVWSPDSKKIATYRQDQRGVGEMYLVDTRVGHPHLEAWKYPLPGDKVVTTIERVVVDLDGPRVVRLLMPPDQHRSTLCDDVACRGVWEDVQWSPDSAHLAFVSTSRDHKSEQLRVADASTGAVRDALAETVSTFYESGNGRVNWRYLPRSNQIIWFSERDNWGQLYLFDLETGRLKNQITTGEGNVTQLLRVDEPSRMIYFLAVGREKGRDPYYVHFYRIGFDGKNQQLLTPEDATHDVTLSPSGRYFVDSYSRPDVPPVTLLRDADGELLMTLERADIGPLVATGWKPPVPFTVKARDGVTDLYGLMFVPTRLDPAKRYPIINHIYPGPQTGSVGSRNFSASRGDCQSLAELGFVVVEIDGMGTPWRSKKFHEAYYGDMGDNTLPDQVAGMRQLAARYPWIDVGRAGIYGHSGGGYAAADAMFRYPDFFKVGVSEAGNHDNRDYEDDWAEKWQGLLVKNPDGATNYDNQANEDVAKNLKGHLLLAHGTMDTNVPPYNTLLVVDALIAANRDFDLILFPNRSHGFGNEPYMVRRRWDYFARYLLGAEPPKEFQLHPPAELPSPPGL
ncbi:MAG TPA: DPP IV N-terminal domain-containing protein [Candidatus Acidoferrales bacterium]|nr:DPP IV N-terminal domain-containing protein [Candidatus Acidoferrales bacterium]